MFPELNLDSRGFVIVPIKRSNNFVSLHYLLDGDKLEHDTVSNRHSNETVTVRKHVTKHSNMRKLIVLFPRKCENSGIKIARLNLNLITNSINYFNFLLCWGPLWCNHIQRFSVYSRLIEKSMYSIYIVHYLLKRAYS